MLHARSDHKLMPSVPFPRVMPGSPQSKLLIDAHFDPLNEQGCEWTLNHRADVQKELWRLATTEEGPGRPTRILLGARVTDLVRIISPDACTRRSEHFNQRLRLRSFRPPFRYRILSAGL